MVAQSPSSGDQHMLSASSISAPAKLNLSLAVLGKRADGFHEIESLMVPVTLHDTLSVRATTALGINLRVIFGGRLAHPSAAALRRDVPSDASNLVVRAAQALADIAGVEQGLDVELVKAIPSGAGLGGGSSDAAAALVGLDALWELALPASEFQDLAAALGSAVSTIV